SYCDNLNKDRPCRKRGQLLFVHRSWLTACDGGLEYSYLRATRTSLQRRIRRPDNACHGGELQQHEQPRPARTCSQEFDSESLPHGQKALSHVPTQTREDRFPPVLVSDRWNAAKLIDRPCPTCRRTRNCLHSEMRQLYRVHSSMFDGIRPTRIHSIYDC